MTDGPIHDIVQDIKLNIIEQFDYSDLFPSTNPDGTAYTFKKGPFVVTGWPWQLDQQMVGTKNSQMTQPYISLVGLHFGDIDRTFGDIYQTGAGLGPLQLRLGRRAEPSVLISCWANQQLGGMNMSRKLAGYTFSAIFQKRNYLKTMRGLHVIASHEEVVDAAGLYRVDLTVSGRALIVVDI